ncbi:hypothetical protein OG589_08460 [Sphaerisporangium sp. NBC_01403]|uniref:hypothetical protein n=1 Tax=Sphaerisporangium sp. NBC_01403 TaxID=2903599 RepID=UPI003252017A
MIPFTPGYADDFRSDRKRLQDASSYVGDFEGAAGRVVARLTGEYVALQDDGSADRMPDLKIVYSGGRTAYGEVTLDIDESYAALGSEVLKRQYQVAAPSLKRIWWVTLSPKVRVNRLERSLPLTLQKLEATGDTFETVLFEQRLREHRNPLVRVLAEVGVIRLASRPIQPSEAGLIHIGAGGTGGPVELDWASFIEYVASFLSDESRADVRLKLAATEADERHAFVGLTFTTPWPAYHALNHAYSGLPPEPPRLPAEITHLWVWAYPLGRCIGWFPDQGWFDPRGRWATD